MLASWCREAYQPASSLGCLECTDEVITLYGIFSPCQVSSAMRAAAVKDSSFYVCAAVSLIKLIFKIASKISRDSRVASDPEGGLQDTKDMQARNL